MWFWNCRTVRTVCPCRFIYIIQFTIAQVWTKGELKLLGVFYQSSLVLHNQFFWIYDRQKDIPKNTNKKCYFLPFVKVLCRFLTSVPNSDTNYRAIKTELGPEKLAELAEQRLGLPDNSLGRKLYRMTSGRPYLTL